MTWLNYLPSGLPQYLKEDTNGCSDYAPVDSIESQELAITGVQTQYSRRWLAKLSGTSVSQGNSEQVVFPTIAQYGLVLESSWPQRSDMTNDEFYAEPTAEQRAALLAEGQAWLRKLDVSYNFNVPFSDISKAPLIARLQVPGTYHFVEVLDQNWYYDSEAHGGKIGVCPPYGTVISYHQIIIKRKPVMLVFFQVKGNSTLWILDQGQWVGFSDMTAFNSYVGGRPNVVVELDQTEFNKLAINPNVHKV